MVRKTLFLAAAITLSLCLVGNSYAAEESTQQNVSPADASSKRMEMYISADGLMAQQNIDEQNTIDKFSGPLVVDFDNSGGFQFRWGIKMTPSMYVEAMFEYIFPFEALSGTDSSELEIMDFGVNAKIVKPLMDNKLVPYALLGISHLNAYEEIYYSGSRSKTSNWGSAARGGIGVDYFIKDDVSCHVEGAYVYGFEEVDHIRFSTISAGFAYHF
jgi:opacity protein-like surface antigen